MIDPVIANFGAVSLTWYGLMYVVGFFVVWRVLSWRIQKKEIKELSQEDLLDMLSWGFLGMLLGGRFGYVFLYDGALLWSRPWEIFWPFDAYGMYTGISGMSFHGALLGGALALWLIGRKKKKSFFRMADILVVVAPLGIFFGRIGNFINGELFGRETSVAWAMDFGDGVLRHPSQLYEAFFEGIALFLLLWFFRKRGMHAGMLTCIFLVGYGVLRFFIEFFREPDLQMGFILFDWMSMGQVLSGIMIVIGLLGLFFLRNKDGTR